MANAVTVADAVVVVVAIVVVIGLGGDECEWWQRRLRGSGCHGRQTE
ncbi:hypothetical protein [Saccharopolyspora thermophila]|nr:hypothetical protein [Saccharopolyspora subtropica]